MSYYDERFNLHPVHKTIKDLKNEIEESIPNIDEKLSQEFAFRVLKIISLAEVTLKNADIDYVQLGVLNTINKACLNIANDFKAYFADNDQNHLETAANTRGENILSNLSQVYRIPETEKAKELEDSFNGLLESISKVVLNSNSKAKVFEEKFKSIVDELHKLKITINEQIEVINKQKSRLDKAISQYQTQFLEEEGRRRETFDKKIHTFDTEHLEFQKKFQKEIDGFKNNSLSEISTILGKLHEDTKAVKEKYISEFSEIIETAKKDTLEVNDYLNKRKDDAKRLLNIIANIGVTGNYNKIADDEKKTANILRWISVGFMGIGIILIIYFVYNFSKSPFDWRILISKIGVTITLFIPAFYMARESNRHRQREIHNRKMELELASIGPYLELLPKEKQDELKAKLSEKFFGQPEIIRDDGEVVTKTTLFGLVEKIATILAKGK
ncbi:hypothetical protein [uncultured Desulfosarcina sp.]|uniref:hypothetical protein n=1 Tax=uncultured Desulfosarcina sp. TaxID=218289 RepID=UPI0029C96283|nr:hypothetical protein [uncultured Desulfosarcina sp.]